MLLVAGFAGCGGFKLGGFKLGGLPEAVVQENVSLPRGTRVAVVPITLYGYSKEQRRSVENAAYASAVAQLLKAGFRVVERSLVDKAVDEYVRTKRYGKVPGAQGAVYQAEGEGDQEDEKLIDLVEIGRTLNVRLVAAGSIQLTSGFMSSKVEVRLRATDVVNGEMVSHCETSGSPKVIEACAESMSQQLSIRMVGGLSLGSR